MVSLVSVFPVKSYNFILFQ